MVFSPDGKWLATAGRELTLREATTGRPLRTFSGHPGDVWGVAFSPDGHCLASASVDRTVNLWDVASGREIHTLCGHRERVLAVAFSPDGQRLATGSMDATVKVWNARIGREIRTLFGHVSDVHCVAFSPDGRRLASGSGYGRKGEVQIWDVTAFEKSPDQSDRDLPLRSEGQEPTDRP